jgi:hypothetical protein
MGVWAGPVRQAKMAYKTGKSISMVYFKEPKKLGY